MATLTRRAFVTGSAGLAGILAARVAPARAQQREISYLCWNNFAPASDKKLAEIAERFTKDTGIKLRLDHIAAPQQPAKYASEVQSQAGHDVVEMRMHFPWLYETQLVDVSDLVAEMEKKYGAASSSAAETAKVKGRWRAVPQYHAMFVAAYREDLFQQASLKVPDTWEDLYVAGKELKKMGHPVGIPISQNYDSISTASPVLWSLGGLEVDQDGKTVRINSPATEALVEWYRKMFRDCMEPEVLSWTDASNNESLQQGKAGWIHNPVSAYIVAKQRDLPTAPNVNHHRSLAGPKGRHETDVPRHIGIWKFSKNVELAKQWIRYLLGQPAVYDEYIMSGDAFNLPVYAKMQDHAVLSTDPKYAALRPEPPAPAPAPAAKTAGKAAAKGKDGAAAKGDVPKGEAKAAAGKATAKAAPKGAAFSSRDVQYHCYGWPAPASDKVQLITNSFILPNMIAKAVTGTSTKDAVAWADKEMKKIMKG